MPGSEHRVQRGCGERVCKAWVRPGRAHAHSSRSVLTHNHPERAAKQAPKRSGFRCRGQHGGPQQTTQACDPSADHSCRFSLLSLLPHALRSNSTAERPGVSQVPATNCSLGEGKLSTWELGPCLPYKGSPDHAPARVIAGRCPCRQGRVASSGPEYPAVGRAQRAVGRATSHAMGRVFGGIRSAIDTRMARCCSCQGQGRDHSHLQRDRLHTLDVLQPGAALQLYTTALRPAPNALKPPTPLPASSPPPAAAGQ